MRHDVVHWSITRSMSQWLSHWSNARSLIHKLKIWRMTCSHLANDLSRGWSRTASTFGDWFHHLEKAAAPVVVSMLEMAGTRCHEGIPHQLHNCISSSSDNIRTNLTLDLLCLSATTSSSMRNWFLSRTA